MFTIFSHFQTAEVVTLYQYVKSGNASEAGVASACLVALVCSGKIPAVTLLTNLLADVISAACPAPTVQAITQLMLIMSDINWNNKEQAVVHGNSGVSGVHPLHSINQQEVRQRDLCNDTELNVSSGIRVESHLVNAFTGPPVGPVCPYVTLVRKKPELTSIVLEECEYLLFHPDRRYFLKSSDH